MYRAALTRELAFARCLERPPPSDVNVPPTSALALRRRQVPVKSFWPAGPTTVSSVDWASDATLGGKGT